MNHYTLSILMEPKTGITCVTCPKGNLVTFRDGEKAAYISSLNIKDAGSVTLSPDGNSFLITTGAGEFLTLPIDSIKDPKSLAKHAYLNTHYDNHITVALWSWRGESTVAALFVVRALLTKSWIWRA